MILPEEKEKASDRMKNSKRTCIIQTKDFIEVIAYPARMILIYYNF